MRYEDYLAPAVAGYSFDLGSWHIISLPSAAWRVASQRPGEMVRV
jgi:hypothetical protein